MSDHEALFPSFIAFFQHVLYMKTNLSIRPLKEVPDSFQRQ
jgi:hypothetical protein